MAFDRWGGPYAGLNSTGLDSTIVFSAVIRLGLTANFVSLETANYAEHQNCKVTR
jgi:hypothetical protein